MNRKESIISIFRVAFAIIENLTCGCLVFGWPSLAFMLTDKGIFGEMCSNDRLFQIIEAENKINISLSPTITNNTSESDKENGFLRTIDPILPDIDNQNTFNSSILKKIVHLNGTNINQEEALIKDANRFLIKNESFFPFKTRYRFCYPQHEIFNFIFSMSVFFFCCTPFITKLITDMFEIWLVRLLASFFITLGTMLFAVSSVNNLYVIVAAICFLSIGGSMIWTLNTKIVELYPNNKLLVSIILNAAIYLSSLVFLLMRLLVDVFGFEFQYLFLFYFTVPVFIFVRTFFLNTQPLTSLVTSFSAISSIFGNIQQTPFTVRSKTSLTVTENLFKYNKSLIDCIRDETYFLFFIHTACLKLRLFFFLGSFVTWLQRILPLHQSHFMDYFTYLFSFCQLLVILIVPFYYFFIVQLKKKFLRKYHNEALSRSQTITISSASTSFLGFMFSLLVCLRLPYVQYFSFVVYPIFAAFLICNTESSLVFLYPKVDKSRIASLTLLAVSFIVLLQIPLFRLGTRIFENNLTSVNIMFVFVTFCTFIHPLFLYLMSKRHQELLKLYVAQSAHRFELR